MKCSSTVERAKARSKQIARDIIKIKTVRFIFLDKEKRYINHSSGDDRKNHRKNDKNKINARFKM